MDSARSLSLPVNDYCHFLALPFNILFLALASGDAPPLPAFCCCRQQCQSIRLPELPHLYNYETVNATASKLRYPTPVYASSWLRPETLSAPGLPPCPARRTGAHLCVYQHGGRRGAGCLFCVQRHATQCQTAGAAFDGPNGPAVTMSSPPRVRHGVCARAAHRRRGARWCTRRLLHADEIPARGDCG